MCTINQMIEGLTILSKYYNKYGESYNLGADHDVVYIYQTDRPVSDEDVARLRKMSFFQENVDHEEGEPYDPREGWMVYV